MKVQIDLKKSIEKNASTYFEKSKKAKLKLEGANKALKIQEKKLSRFVDEEIEEEIKVKRIKKWYDKYRFFYTSSKKLVVMGRDATTNEILIKKHTEKDDIVFHTSIPKSPFSVIKLDEKELTKEDIEEVGQATATFSQAWKQNIGNVEVFYVTPEQVSKKAQSGEYLTKGAFMIYGKKHLLKSNLSLAVGLSEDNELLAGPVSSIKSNCKEFIELAPGRGKPSAIAKKIQHKIKANLDDIIRVLPAGGFDLKK